MREDARTGLCASLLPPWAGEGEVRTMTVQWDERRMLVAAKPESPKQEEVVRGMRSFQVHTEF